MSQMALAQIASAMQWYTTTSSVTISTGTTGTYVPFFGQQFVDVVGAVQAANNTFSPMLEKGRTYTMPDGSRIVVESDGSYTIDDKDAKVIYRAASVRDFNRYLNASDLLEEYISELVPQGVRQDEVLHLEIEHFIFWLVHKASEKDRDPTPDVPKYPVIAARSRHRVRCLCCGRYIRAANVVALGISYCNVSCVNKKLEELRCRGLPLFPTMSPSSELTSTA